MLHKNEFCQPLLCKELQILQPLLAIDMVILFIVIKLIINQSPKFID